MKKIVVMCCAVGLLLSACAEGYEDENTWASKVSNQQLESPAEISVEFSADGNSQTIKWSLVPGAGGYAIKVYNANDTADLKLISEEANIDGLTLTCSSTEDTKFRVEVKALGNTKMNNIGAAEPKVYNYTNMVPVFATIPAGSLNDYFSANPISDKPDWVCYELTAGADYSMTADINIGATPVVFRSTSTTAKANITVSGGSFVSAGGGLKLQRLDMDFSSSPGEGELQAVVRMDGATFPHPSTTLTAGGYVAVLSKFPIAIQSCNIKGLKQYLFHDGNKKYGIGNFVINDCVIEHVQGFGNAIVRFQGGTARSFSMTNSTYYCTAASVSGNMRFMQFNTGNRPNQVQPAGEDWTNCTLIISNNTFWQAGKGAQSFNSNGFGNNALDVVIVTNNIFVDSYELSRIVSRFRRGNSTALFTGDKNTQWYNGANVYDSGSDATADIGYITTDPQLKDPSNGDFTVQGSAQITARTGDPRWLPAQ